MTRGALVRGLAFAVPSDAGFIVGLFTHQRSDNSSLVWIANPTFDEVPGVEDVLQIDSWRWPTFFMLAAALSRGLVIHVGVVPVPAELDAFPVVRSGARNIGWLAYTEENGVRRRLGPTNDPTLPISRIVNLTSLKSKVVSGWMPELVW